MEKKIPDVVYFKTQLWYDVVFSRVATTVAGGSQGGVGLVLWERPEGWGIYSTCFHGPNVVICNILSGSQQTPLIGTR